MSPQRRPAAREPEPPPPPPPTQPFVSPKGKKPSTLSPIGTPQKMPWAARGPVVLEAIEPEDPGEPLEDPKDPPRLEALGLTRLFGLGFRV